MVVTYIYSLKHVCRKYDIDSLNEENTSAIGHFIIKHWKKNKNNIKLLNWHMNLWTRSRGQPKYTSNLVSVQRCIKFPTIWYSSPPQFFNILIFFPKMSSFTQDNLPYSLNTIEQMILLPLALYSTWYSSKRPLNSLPLYITWNSGAGLNTFIYPCFSGLWNYRVPLIAFVFNVF